jgi:hypothetical protein
LTLKSTWGWGVFVGGTGVLVGWGWGVFVGGALVGASVGGSGVAVGGTSVGTSVGGASVGGTAVSVAGTSVGVAVGGASVGGTAVSVDGGVGVAVWVLVNNGRSVLVGVDVTLDTPPLPSAQLNSSSDITTTRPINNSVRVFMQQRSSNNVVYGFHHQTPRTTLQPTCNTAAP